MAKIKVYKCIEDFKIVINEKITIEKGQLIPEDFFIKNFASPKKQINILLNLKKIKKETKDEKVNSSNSVNK